MATFDLDSPAGPQPAPLDLITQRVPAWLTHAGADDRAAYHQALKRNQAAAAKVAALIRRFKAPGVFAESVLSAAIQARFNLDIDVSSAQWVQFQRTYQLDRRVTSVRRRTLLEAAMNNFAADEPFDGDTLLLPADALQLVVAENFGWRYDPARVLAIAPARFAELCRSLDLGQAYQAHFNTVFKPQDGSKAWVRASLESNIREELTVQAHRAMLRGDIAADERQVLLDLVAEPEVATKWNGQPVVISSLQALVTWFTDGYPLSGLRVIQTRAAADAPCIVYMPGEPDTPLKTYASFAVLADDLRERLRRLGYADYFGRFIAQADRQTFLQRLNDTLRPTPFAPWASPVRQDDPHADIGLRLKPGTGRLVAGLCDTWLDKLAADARAFVVPSADVDKAVREARLLEYAELGLTLLNASAFFVPGVGVLMAAVGTAQLLGDLFVGIDDWTHGQTEQAVSHFFNVAENAALVAVTAGAGVAIARSPFVEGMLPVIDRAGTTRLWNVTLDDFASQEPLPDHLVPNAAGQYQWAGAQYIKMDGVLYRQSHDAELGQWHLEHPDRKWGMRIPLRHNGEGAWRAAHEDPRQWTSDQAMRRLGPPLDDMNAATLQRIRQAAGYRGRQIRALHLNDAPMPAALRVCAEDWQAASAASSSWPIGHPAEALHRDFPSLPAAFGDEIWRRASALERNRLRTGQKVPLRLAVMARKAVWDYKLNRAISGLLLPQLTGTQSVRLHEGLLKLLPAAQRPAATAKAVFELAIADRPRAARLLGQRRPSTFTTPQRLEDGRLGFRLSGRARLPEEPVGPGMAAGLAQARREAEGARLASVLERWAAQPATVLDTRGEVVAVDPADRLEARERIMAAWRNQAPAMDSSPWPHSRYFLDLSELRIGPLPTLEGDFSRISYLSVENSGLASFPPGFLLSFPGLAVLDLQGNFLTEIPAEVSQLSALESIALEHNRLAASPGMFDRLRDLHQLQALILRDNPMRIPAQAMRTLASLTPLRYLSLDMTDNVAMAEHLLELARLPNLGNLWLRDTGLVLTPAAMQALASMSVLDSLDLSGNPLGEHLDLSLLPVIGALDLRNCGLQAWPRGLTDLMSRDPLSLRRVALEDNPIVEVPPLQALAFFGEHSEVITPLTLSHTHLSARSLARLSAVGVNFDYLTLLAANADIDSAQRLETLRQAPGSARFMQLLARLSDTADSRRVPEHLATRAWAVIDGAARSPSLREDLFALAQRPETCGDEVIALFNDLEAALMFAQANDPTLDGPQRAAELLATSRSLFRLDRVEAIARLDMRQRIEARGMEPDEFEEVELLLAYRIGLAQRLGLLNQPEAMLFAATEPVTTAQLDAAAAQVLAAETLPALLDWHMGQDYWRGYLRRQHAAQLEQTLAPFQLRREALAAQAYDDAYDEQLVALQVEEQAAEAALLRQLTEQAMAG